MISSRTEMIQSSGSNQYWCYSCKLIGGKKEFKIPGAPQYQTFNSMVGVKNFLKKLGNEFVVKFDGLAGGKGVKVSGEHLKSHRDALEYCEELTLSGGRFVVEEKFITCRKVYVGRTRYIK